MVQLQVREAPKEGPRGAASCSSSDCKGRGLAKPLGVDKGIGQEELGPNPGLVTYYLGDLVKSHHFSGPRWSQLGNGNNT